MRTRPRILDLLIILCGTFATTVGFGQTTYTWTGAGDGTNLANPANWSPVGLPAGCSGFTQDTAQWDGVTKSNLFLTYGSTSFPCSGYGSLGINLVLTANQTNAVQIISPVFASANLAVFGIANNSASAAFILGDGTANILNFSMRPAGTVHSWVNNSAAPVTINPSVGWQAGGGAAYSLDFGGTGDWIVNNYLNGSGTVTSILKDGSGTMTWTAAGSAGYGSISPVNLNDGTLILKSAGLLANGPIINNGTLLQFDAAAQLQILGGVISGAGPLEVNNGTLTLSGANTYTGNTILSGGELIAGGAENAGVSGPLGLGGTISFAGGTLGFSVTNTFDYSARFSTAASQAYSFDTAGQSATFATGLGSSGGTLTKAGAGTLTLSGTSSYSGATTVSAGKLVFQGPKTGSAGITVADGAALGVTATGTEVTPGALTVGTSAGATLELNNVTSTTTALLAAGTLSSAGTLTINVNSGTFAAGQSYPLFTWTSGSAPTVALGILNGFVGYLSFAGNTLLLNVTGTAYKWSGANNGSWDLTTTNNWIQNGGPVIFKNGFPTLFDDTATGTTSVTINDVVWPASLTVNNSFLAYRITSSSQYDIAGSTGLTKSGNGWLTLAGGANAYTGVTTISGGTLSVGTLANGGSASDIGAASSGAANLVFNGGTLQYTGGGASIDRMFTLGTGGGTIDASGSGALNLNNTGAVAYSGTGARVLTLTGTDADTNTLAAALADHGGATSLAKTGAGRWVLTGTNTQSGVTTIAGGVLQIGAGGASGSIGSGNVTDNGNLDFNRSGTLTVSGVISGTGSVANDGSGIVILPGTNTYAGGTTINAGTLQIGTGGATGSLYSSGNITDNGTLIFNSTGAFTLNSAISGTGQLIKQGSGLLKLLGNNTYTGGTTINAGAALQVCTGNQGSIVGNITNNGSLLFVRQDTGVFVYGGNISGTGSVLKDCNNFNFGDVTFTGTNTYSGGTIICAGAIILGDNATPGAGSIVGNVLFTNSLVTAYDPGRTLTFNRPDNFTFSGVISGSGSTNSTLQGGVVQAGNGTVTLTANHTYSGITTISNGTLQVGAGGASGWIGSGTNGVTNYGALVFDRSDNVTFGNVISGTGSVVQLGSGTLTLTGTNTYSGPTVVSNGTLVVSSAGGDMDVSGGILDPGGVGSSVGTLTVAGNMSITSGVVVVSLNKALSPSNSIVSVAGTITNYGGTLKLLNFGPDVVVGDQFNIFGQAVEGAVLTIVSPGFTVSTSSLAVNGSVTVTGIAAGQVTATLSGTQLNLAWPASYTGADLQVQTNPLTKGLSTNWLTVPGTEGGNSYSTPVNKTNGSVFYRLAP